VDVPEAYADIIERHGILGTFVGASDEESPWGAVRPQCRNPPSSLRPPRNIFSNILRIKSAGVIGTHLDRGAVVMVCLEGSARYLEYDWVAGPGSFICETPGLVHTLVTDSPNGVKLFGWLEGPN